MTISVLLIVRAGTHAGVNTSYIGPLIVGIMFGIAAIDNRYRARHRR